MSSPLSSDALAALDSESRSEVARAELSADTLEALAVDTPLVPPREPLGARLASYFGRHLILLFCISFGCLWAILSFPSPFNRPDFAPGGQAPRDYVAPQNAFLPDRMETMRRREAAAALVTPAYDPAPSAQAEALALLREVSEKSRLAAAAMRTTPPAPPAGSKVPAPSLPPEDRRFEARAGWRPSPDIMATLRGLQVPRWRAVEKVADAVVREAYVRGRIRSDVGDDLGALRPLLRQTLIHNDAAQELSSQEREIALQLAIQAARIPNVVVNQKATDNARTEASEAVLPVFLRVEANTPLVRQGERVSHQQWEQLQELGLIEPQFRLTEALANGALCLLLVLGAAAYLARGRRDLLQRPSALWLISVIPVLFLAAFRMLLGVPHADFMMVPLAATAAMLLTVLIDTRVGLPAGFVVAALCALMGKAEAGLFLAATLSAWIGALSVARLSSRFALIRSIALLTVSNAILAVSLGILRDSPVEELLSSAAWSGLAGAGSVVAMAGLAIFLERPFGITSHLRLLELLAPDETVIRRMQLEAPGTYTHSMTVAILAESAAKSVGADPLLCRVAGLYHDIGKLRRPHCFIENQSGDNIHDHLSPGLSALLIKAHVKDGLELGRAVRLPQPVLDTIASHHGTGTIAYFLHRARKLAQAEGTEVDERTFRYPGPKPRTREAAIVMLADSVEASARCLPQITPEILLNHVQTLISARLSEGQLDECDLSLKEMSIVRDSFVAVLRGVLHGRIAYPDPAALSGELSAPSNNWVRQTLGERTDEAPKTQKNPQKVATPPQKRQNKERRQNASQQAAVTDVKVDGNSGTKIEGQGPTESSNPNRARRRRFKPPFHAPGNGTSSNGPTTKSAAPRPENPTANNGENGNGSSSGTQPELDPRRASGPASELNGNGHRSGPVTSDDSATQKNGTNGHQSHAPASAPALSGSECAAEDG